MRPIDFDYFPPDFEAGWFLHRTRQHVLIFVHGLFSTAKISWLFEDLKSKSSAFWPDLIANDQRFVDYDLFLASYHTGIDSADYGIENCAEELFDNLHRTSVEGIEGPLKRNSIIFVCHSTGGIVVRYMLERYSTHFTNISIGLILIASPSYGSRHADTLRDLSKLYKHKLGLQLRWGSASLHDLDRRFRDLVAEKRIPRLSGIEAVEHQPIFRYRGLPQLTRVVQEESASRYFGRPRVLYGTDHFSCVKPSDQNHPAHQLLVDFCHQYARDFRANSDSDTTSASIDFELGEFGPTLRDHVVITWRSNEEETFHLHIKVRGPNSARNIRELLEVVYMSGLSRVVPGMSYGADWILEDIVGRRVFAPIGWLGATFASIPSIEPGWGGTSLQALKIHPNMRLDVVLGQELDDLRDNVCGIACHTSFGENVLLDNRMLAFHLVADHSPGVVFRVLAVNESSLAGEIGVVEPSDVRALGAKSFGIIHLPEYGKHSLTVSKRVILDGMWLENSEMVRWYRDV